MDKFEEVIKEKRDQFSKAADFERKIERTFQQPSKPKKQASSNKLTSGDKSTKNRREKSWDEKVKASPQPRRGTFFGKNKVPEINTKELRGPQMNPRQSNVDTFSPLLLHSCEVSSDSGSVTAQNDRKGSIQIKGGHRSPFIRTTGGLETTTHDSTESN